MENLEQAQAEQHIKKESNLGLKGLVEIFYQPSKFYERLKDEPRILVPWIVFFLLIFSSIYLISDLIAEMQMDIMKEKADDQGLGTANLPTATQIKWSTIIIGPLAFMLSPLIAAGLALFIGNVVMAGRATYKQLLSVMLFGEIVYGLGAIIMAPLMLAKGSMNVSISLAALLQKAQVQDPLYVALSKFGAFYIWEIIVIGIGLSIIYGFTRNKGYTLAVLSMGMISIMHALTQLAFG